MNVFCMYLDLPRLTHSTACGMHGHGDVVIHGWDHVCMYGWITEYATTCGIRPKYIGLIHDQIRVSFRGVSAPFWGGIGRCYARRRATTCVSEKVAIYPCTRLLACLLAFASMSRIFPAGCCVLLLSRLYQPGQAHTAVAPFTPPLGKKTGGAKCTPRAFGPSLAPRTACVRFSLRASRSLLACRTLRSVCRHPPAYRSARPSSHRRPMSRHCAKPGRLVTHGRSRVGARSTWTPPTPTPMSLL